MPGPLSSPRPRLGLLAVVTALVALAGPLAASDTLAASKSRRGSHHTTHHRTSHRSHSCIPQGGGGDNDADNHGGPSDGDGCV